MDTVDELTDAFLSASRALVAVAIRSVDASPVDITVVQHRVLVLLASRGETSVGRIADHLGVNQSNASRICDRLQRLGLLGRARSAEDGRVVRVSLTPDGKRVVDAVTRHRRAEVRAVLERIPEVEADHVIEALAAFTAAAEEPPERDWTP